MTKNERVPIAAIWGLGLTQIIGYGTLYYSFSILAPAMAQDFSVSKEWIFAALSLALLVGGLLAPWLGRLIDRIGAAAVMSIGSVLSALSLIICAGASSSIYFAVTLVGLEVASNLVLYTAAFALLVQISPASAQRSITYLTLIAGFASTIFWPLTAMLEQSFSWHQIYLIFAAMHVMLCLPIHCILAFKDRANVIRRRAAGAKGQMTTGILPDHARPRGFLLLLAGFSLQSLIIGAILVHMVPMLGELGLAASAAFIAAIFGPAQVASRFINMVGGGNISPVNLTLFASGLMSLSIVLLMLGAPNVPLAIAFACLFGFGNGLYSIVSGTLPLSLFGSAGYGTLQGKISSARLVVASLAPFAMAFGMRWIGVHISLAIVIFAGILSVLVTHNIKSLIPRPAEARLVR